MLCFVFYSMHDKKHVSDAIFMFVCFFGELIKPRKATGAVEGEETSRPLLSVDLS